MDVLTPRPLRLQESQRQIARISSFHCYPRSPRLVNRQQVPFKAKCSNKACSIDVDYSLM